MISGRAFFRAWAILALFAGVNCAQAQTPVLSSDTAAEPHHNRRLYWVAAGSAATYTASLVVLSEAWYKEQPRTGFHWHNDNGQWLQLDKAGHLLTSFHESRFGVEVLRWAGAQEKPAILVGGLLGFVLQSPIEILDGQMKDYGASWGDLAANAAGSGLVIGQYLAWKELRITPKFSFSRSPFAKHRPNVLGRDLNEQILKDYNGQTYWLTVQVHKFLPEENRWPAWLGVAAGYGGNEMVYNDADANRAAGFSAYRQYYLAPDFNLRAIKTRSKALKVAFYLLDVVHLPAPALEFSERKGLRLHPLFF